MSEIEQADLTTLTVELLSAFVSNNTVESTDLAGLIQSTHAALSGINAPPPPEPVAPEFVPAVTVRKSLGSRDHILSLIDGKPYKTLKRHLSGHGLTPAEYRERYKLPADYPMVAPSYSQHRRDVAERLGLGRKPVKTAERETSKAEELGAPTPDALVAGGTPPTNSRKAEATAATSKQAKAETATSATKPPKATKLGVKRAEKAATPEAAVAPKDQETKTTPRKAKRDAAVGSQIEPKPEPAKRGRPKANMAPTPAE